MPDARAADAQVLEVRHLIRATPAAVFRAWTMPSSVKEWLSTPEAPVRTVTIEPRPGGRFEVACDYQGGTWRLDGTVREIAEPSLLEFTWVTSDFPAEVGSVVRVEFLQRPGGTEVVITQRGFPSGAKLEDNRQGWIELLPRIEALLAA